MNLVDLIIIAILILFAFEALGRSVFLETLDFISFLLAGLLSFSYYNLPARYLEAQFQIPHGLSLVLGFLIIWFLSEIIFFVLVRLIVPLLPKANIPLSNFISIIPALLRAFVFIAVGLVITATFPIQPVIKKAVMESLIGSRILKNTYNLEAPVKNVFGGLSNDTLTFLTIKPQTDEKVNLGFQTEDVSIDEKSEKAMVEMVNFERTTRGLSALTFDFKLREVGRKHSEDMFKRGYFAHISPEGWSVADRAQKMDVDFLVIGENLAYAPLVELAFKGLMNSEGHKANILSEDYNKIGIGVMDGGIYGKMFTQVFSD